MMEKASLVLSEQLEGSIRGLALANDQPFYLYDTARILRNCRGTLDIPYAPKSIHFAMMANSTAQFLRIIKEAGLGIFVNSILHLEAAVEQGYIGEEIVYAASAMDEEAMKKVGASGALVILDSIGQYDQWLSLFPSGGIGIRCNIGELVVPRETLAGYFIGRESRLGLTIEEIGGLKGDPRIRGLHTYVGTDIVDVDYFLDCYSHVADLAGSFPALQFLDFGGGFGLGVKPGQEFDIKVYGQRVSMLMDQVSDRVGRRIKLILEPGRIIGGNAGYFVCRVVDVKTRGDRQLIGVNASCVQFPRPLFYPDSAFHPVSILHRDGLASGKDKFISSVFGCSTYSRDFLARDVLLPQTLVGDIVVLGYAGAYCAAAHTSFLGFPQANEYFL